MEDDSVSGTRAACLDASSFLSIALSSSRSKAGKNKGIYGLGIEYLMQARSTLGCHHGRADVPTGSHWSGKLTTYLQVTEEWCKRMN